MKLHNIVLVVGILTSSSAHAQNLGPIQALVTAGGKCSHLELAGQKVPCSYAKGVIYTLLSNGRVLFTIGLSKDKILAFVGSKDSQPSAGNYFLYLSRVDITTKAMKSFVDVGGECHLSLSRSGKIWYALTCNAQDADGAAYLLDYKFTDKPVHSYH